MNQSYIDRLLDDDGELSDLPGLTRRQQCRYLELLLLRFPEKYNFDVRLLEATGSR
jgi:hypothetical protein